ncbi:ribbon-helix-helix protein, CopG family [Nostoc sp. CCY0012]|uniref:ribbon-helix-helix domain-containing protein n=1 Tax=Nostoc sp. CCY0012 TaxID=1056123 RepID=UPI0039C5B862
MPRKKSIKPDWMRKRSHVGTPCRKGKPIYYEEVKKNINLTLTPTALNRLKELAIKMKISRSEVVERWLRIQ